MLSDLPHLAPLLVTLSIFVALWPLSLMLRDASVVDGWWAPGFVAQLLVVAALLEKTDARDIVLITLVGIWSARLGWLLVRRRLREGTEDPRYTSLRNSWGEGFWWKSLFIVFLLQGVIQWAIALGPISGMLADERPIGWLALTGIVVAVGGLALETVADAQLDRFKRGAPTGALCQSGLRAWLRHPNYLGEIVFWTGIGLVVSEVNLWAALLSPVLITVFLVWVSGAPMLEERLSETRPDYADYRRDVPGFLPSVTSIRKTRQAGRGTRYRPYQ